MPHFEVGDEIYRRCPETWAELPFETIPLYDLSVNRATIGKCIVSQPGDARVNITADCLEDLYLPVAVVTLTVRETDAAYQSYFKTLTRQDGDKIHTLTLCLKHDCVPCNYAHSVIELTYNGQVLTKENYQTVFGKLKGIAKIIRQEARREITRMITYRELWINEAQ